MEVEEIPASCVCVLGACRAVARRIDTCRGNITASLTDRRQCYYPFRLDSLISMSLPLLPLPTDCDELIGKRS